MGRRGLGVHELLRGGRRRVHCPLDVAVDHLPQRPRCQQAGRPQLSASCLLPGLPRTKGTIDDTRPMGAD